MNDEYLFVCAQPGSGMPPGVYKWCAADNTYYQHLSFLPGVVLQETIYWLKENKIVDHCGGTYNVKPYLPYRL